MQQVVLLYEIISVLMETLVTSNMNLRLITANTNFAHIANQFIFAKLCKMDEQPIIARYANNEYKNGMNIR